MAGSRCRAASRSSPASTTRAGPTTRGSARRRRRGFATASAPAPAASRSGRRWASARGTRTAGSSPVDDPRLDPLWAAAGELGVPVTIHVADPIAFFEPLDAAQRARRGAARPPGLALLADPPARPAGRAGLPAVRRAHRRARGRRRAPSGDDLHRRPRRLRRRGPGTRRPDARQRTRTGTWTSRPGSASSGRQPYGDAEPVPALARPRSCSGSTWRPDPAIYARPLPLPRDARRVVPVRRRRRGGRRARAAGRSMGSACPTTSSGRSTATTRGGSSASTERLHRREAAAQLGWLSIWARCSRPLKST